METDQNYLRTGTAAIGCRAFHVY